MSVPTIESAPYYLDWGVVHISLANVLIILAMLIVFLLALLLPFPGSRAERTPPEHLDEDSFDDLR
jgi:hypothetical protein